MYETPKFFTKADVCYNNAYFEKEKVDNLIIMYKKNREAIFKILSDCIKIANNKNKKILGFYDILPINEIKKISNLVSRSNNEFEESFVLLVVQIFRSCNIDYICEAIYGDDVGKKIKLRFGMLKSIKNNKNLKYPLLNAHFSSFSMKRTGNNIKTHESCTYVKIFSLLFVILCDYYININLFTIMEG